MAREASLTGIISLQSSVWQRKRFGSRRRIQRSRISTLPKLRNTFRLPWSDLGRWGMCTKANISSKSEAKIFSPPCDGHPLFPELYLRAEWDPQGGNFSQKLGYFLQLSWDTADLQRWDQSPLISIYISSLALSEYFLILF